MMMLVAVLALMIAPVALCESLEVITLACGLETCSDVAPQTAYDLPLCNDEQLDTILIDAMNGGDPSALPLLEQRHDTALSYLERHRIANALLGHVVDDRKYWNELAAIADEAIRFAYVDGEPTAEFLSWCEARGVDATMRHDLQWSAYAMVLDHDRGKPFLRRALETNDADLLGHAIEIAASRRDESVLPAIKKAIERMPRDTASLVTSLSLYGSDAIDAYALPLIDDEDYLLMYRDIGERVRQELSESQPNH
jgi:hypothetical protein